MRIPTPVVAGAAGLLCMAAVGGYAFGAMTTAARGERQTTLFEQKLGSVPGRELVALTVDYEPGGISAPHHHGENAEVFAYVVSGAIRSKVNDGPETIYRAGEFWYEPPGSAHGVSTNASATEPARLLAVFVAAEDAELTIVDPAPTVR